MKQPNHYAPPKWPLRLLRLLVKEEYLEEIEGDMEELFQDNLETLSYRQARRMYTWEMIRLMRPLIMKKVRITLSPNPYGMFKNYFKISFRSLMRNPLSAFINIMGLAVAIGICMLVYAFIAYDNNIDQFHTHKHSVYLTTFFADREGTLQQYGQTPGPLGQMLKEDFAQIKHVCRIEDRNLVLKYGDQVFTERVRYTDPTFLEMLTFPLKWGTSQSLADVNSVILSEEMSVKYFGATNPIGENVHIKLGNAGTKTFKVMGVAAPFPKAHAIDFDFLINFENLRLSESDGALHDWNTLVNATFVQVEDPSDLKIIQQGMDKYKVLQNKEVQKDWAISSFAFEPLATLHKNSAQIRDDISVDPPIESLVALPVIGMFMLALACFNYINIALVSTTKRLKEIGVRKVIGANRVRILIQFLVENISVTFFALVLGFILTITVFLPWFIPVSGRELELNLIDSNFWVFLLAILFFTGIASGLYPALYISRFDAVKIFTGSVQFGKKNPLTKLFLGIQLVLSCILITGAVVYMQNTTFQTMRSWGYNQRDVLYVNIPNQAAYEQLQDKMLQNANVRSLAGSKDHLGKKISTAIIHTPANRQYEVEQLAVDAHYVNTMGLQLSDGRNFNDQSENDKHTVIVNELLVKNMELSNPIGHQFRIDSTKYQIIGVVRDFHTHSFYNPIRPTLFKLADKKDYQFLSVQVKNGSQEETYQVLQTQWAALFPDSPFQGGYQEDVWGIFFSQLARMEEFTRTIACMAVLLASLGLYGLVSLNVAGRVREFSIRKVLGARLLDLSVTIARQYLVLIISALAIGVPVSYMLIHTQLNMMFAYPMPMDFSGVSIAVLLLVCVLLGVISIQIRKVAKSNLVKGLKVE
ncbi:ABC transporter permease [Xanthocytophaga flava]|uniref:ABC transporter permease n=1 Tax=Xanthocytophaga flava TaxID=3048013 RepID=UPI0028D73016|nr:ABC transporter permease [Xanthocytophaga flavus]MDJ1470797.1 ABC transporter permease [Xanthocytophaga flavus]